jgi:hypothetical protein
MGLFLKDRHPANCRRLRSVLHAVHIAVHVDGVRQPGTPLFNRISASCRMNCSTGRRPPIVRYLDPTRFYGHFHKFNCNRLDEL